MVNAFVYLYQIYLFIYLSHFVDMYAQNMHALMRVCTCLCVHECVNIDIWKNKFSKEEFIYNSIICYVIVCFVTSYSSQRSFYVRTYACMYVCMYLSIYLSGNMIIRKK